MFQLVQNLTFRVDALYMNLWDSLCFIIPLSMTGLYAQTCTINEQLVCVLTITGCQNMHRSIVLCKLFSLSLYTIQKGIHWLPIKINVCNINNGSTSYCKWIQSYLSIYMIHCNMISIKIIYLASKYKECSTWYQWYI